MRALIVLLASCGSPTAAPLHNATPVAGDDAARAIAIDGSHVGPITGSTKASAAALAPLFPDAVVTASHVTSFDHVLDTVEIRHRAHDAPFLVVIARGDPSLVYGDPTGHSADEIAAIRLYDATFVADARWRIGTSYGELAKLLELDCLPMEDRDAGKIRCEAPGGALDLVFPDLQPTPGASHPPAPNARLLELIWHPSTPRS